MIGRTRPRPMRALKTGLRSDFGAGVSYSVAEPRLLKMLLR